jgi:NifU-like protein involved in Fe-S cluster formation
VYSRKIKHLLLHPINGPKGDNYNAVGVSETTVRCRTNPSRSAKNRVKFMLCVEEGRIDTARWEAFGDPVAIAVASWCVQKVVGKQIDDLAHVVTPENAVLELDITDPLDIRAGCMTTLNALIEALNNYQGSRK